MDTKRRADFLINLLYFVAVAALVVLFFRFAAGWLMPFIIGFAVAMIFAPLIKIISNRLKINRRIAACIVLIVGYTVLITLIAIGAIQLIALLGRVFAQLPVYFNSEALPLFDRIGEFFYTYADSLPPEWVSVIGSIEQSFVATAERLITDISSGGVAFAANFVKNVPGFLIALIFTVLASFFITTNYDATIKFVMGQLSDRGREIMHETKLVFAEAIFKYFKAYAKIMLLTFVELAIGFLIIGVPNALLIAAGIAIFDILPVFGTGGIVIPWILIDFITGNHVQAIGLLVIYGIITVVRNFVEPKIVGDQLGLNPVVSIIAIYLGFVWFGVFGMILMPIAVQIVLTLHHRGVITLYKRVD